MSFNVSLNILNDENSVKLITFKAMKRQFYKSEVDMNFDNI